MQKIMNVFQRDGDRVIDAINPGAEWVAAGEGVATRKFDGSCCLIQGGKLYRRYDSKNGKTPPEGFIPAQDPDPNTGHWPGWLLIGDGPQDRWHREAFALEEFEDGTYELCGPKLQGNPEKLPYNQLIPHGLEKYAFFPRTYEGIKEWFEKYPFIEGVVFHHEDGMFAKIRLRDFGIKRL